MNELEHNLLLGIFFGVCFLVGIAIGVIIDWFQE